MIKPNKKIRFLVVETIEDANKTTDLMTEFFKVNYPNINIEFSWDRRTLVSHSNYPGAVIFDYEVYYKFIDKETIIWAKLKFTKVDWFLRDTAERLLDETNY